MSALNQEVYDSQQEMNELEIDIEPDSEVKEEFRQGTYMRA